MLLDNTRASCPPSSFFSSAHLSFYLFLPLVLYLFPLTFPLLSPFLPPSHPVFPLGPLPRPIPWPSLSLISSDRVF